MSRGYQATSAVQAVLALYPRRDQPKGARSKEAKAQRYAKLTAKHKARATRDDDVPASADTSTPEARAEEGRL